MQVKRIHPGQWYQTKQGIGKCLSTAGKHLKFSIDGKDAWLSSSEVQHEIAEGEEPKQEKEKDPAECPSCHGYGYFKDNGDATTDRRCRKCLDCSGTGRIVPAHRQAAKSTKERTDAAYIAHLEAVNRKLKDSVDTFFAELDGIASTWENYADGKHNNEPHTAEDYDRCAELIRKLIAKMKGN